MAAFSSAARRQTIERELHRFQCCRRDGEHKLAVLRTTRADDQHFRAALLGKRKPAEAECFFFSACAGSKIERTSSPGASTFGMHCR